MHVRLTHNLRGFRLRWLALLCALFWLLQAAQPLPAVEDEDIPDPPPAPRQPPPDSEEQERKDKQQRTREDPFLNPPGGEVGLPAELQYDPADWLLPSVAEGLSRYLVQAASGEVLGNFNLRVSLDAGQPGEPDLVRLQTLSDYAGRRESELWVELQGLRPRRSRTVLEPDVPAAGSTGAYAGDEAQPELVTEVEYLFDRVTISRWRGGISSQERMRQLPYSYDLDVLPLLVRQLDAQHTQWPFEAFIIDPELQRNLPLALPKPERDKVTSAEPTEYSCFTCLLRVGDEERSYWVETLPPRRLVKFTAGGLTFTLLEYVPRRDS